MVNAMFLTLSYTRHIAPVRFRKPTEGNYEYPAYANALGWLMVCSSVIFLPSIMIYEFINAWKITTSLQYQVKILFFR
jgi:hypothetical protein